MNGTVPVDEPLLGLLAKAGVEIGWQEVGVRLQARVPEWAAIVGNAMLAAIMLTGEREVLDMIARVKHDPELQQSVVGSARVGIKPMDLYFMLRQVEDE